jgi:lipopolysaccharide biosynthesis regulator YciM
MIEPLLQAERLLTHGLLDQAEQLYARTLESDPRNAIAAVGLARVAVERDDLRLGHQRACAALEIDRQNPTAVRLERRLAEVLAARGEPVDRPAWLGPAIQPAAAPEPAAPSSEQAPTGESTADDPAAAEPTAEQAVLARNPSMEDHRRMQSERTQPAPADPQPTGSGRPRQRRRGLLRRLLGR